MTCVLFAKMIKFSVKKQAIKKYWKNEKNWKFCQSRKVGTIVKYTVSLDMSFQLIHQMI